MLRRSVPFFCKIPVALQGSRPCYEIIQAALAGSTSPFDSSNPNAAKECALLHKHHIHILADWKHASAATKSALRDSSADGAEAARILDAALDRASQEGHLTANEAAAPKVLIAFGSQTGTAEAMARMTGMMSAAHGLVPVVVSMNEALALLTSGATPFSAALFLCSTYGVGDFPSNAQQFEAALAAPGGKLPGALAALPHAVFGLGNSQNTHSFNEAAKRLSAALTRGGSPSLAPAVFSCELAPEGHDAKFRVWKAAVWAALGRRGVGTGAASAAVRDVYRVANVIGTPAESWKRFDWFQARVTYNECVSAKGFEPAFFRMIAEVPVTQQIQVLGRKLRATDQLLVHPHNPKDAVDRALKLFKLSGSEVIEVTPLPGAAPSFFDGQKITTRTLFSDVIDLSQAPARSALSLLASCAAEGAERDGLEALANDLTSTSEYARLTGPGKVFTVLDVLQRFPSLQRMTLAQAVSRLPHIAPRHYSNSHDPESKLSDKFNVLYSVPTRHDGQRVHRGLCTGMMQALTPANSQLWCTVEEGKSTFPKVASDALFVGLGSGIGLVMAALEQRATARAKGAKVGAAAVVYGHRAAGDNLFQQELQQYVASGVISSLQVVASYETPGQFKSPFDSIDYSWVKQRGADVFYCGVGGSVPFLLQSSLAAHGIDTAQLRRDGKYHEEYFSSDVDEENLLKGRSVAAAGAGTLAEKFAGNPMHCWQCEQTSRGVACTKVGVCGKTPTVAALQDLVTHHVKILGFWLHHARAAGAPELPELNRLTLYCFFTTLTNVNFDEQAFVKLLGRLHSAVAQAKAHCLAKDPAAQLPKDAIDVPAAFVPDVAVLAESGRAVNTMTRFVDAPAQDAASVCEMLLFGLRGVAAYADHSLMNAKESAEIYNFMHKASAYLLSRERHDLGKAVQMCLECGKVNVTAMNLLQDSHSELGTQSPHAVPVKPRPGKCILVSGHDLIMLRELLKRCDAEGISVYTHGEMLPAHAYPELRKHKSLAGHFGTAWYRQSTEFPAFPGAILVTTNCITEPHASYAGKIFTAGAVGWPGVPHIGTTLADMSFDKLVANAKAAPGFSERDTTFTYPDPVGQRRPETLTVGFGHDAILGAADTVLNEVKKGNITRFFVVGGCDGYEGLRSYFSDLGTQIPKEKGVILTVGCGKFRLNALELGTIGDTGIPRLLDMGQCNDAVSAVKVATALAKVLKCEVSDLPISIALSWLEQKAVAVLLSLISLGIKPIRIGPSLPAFITPNVLKVLVAEFGILPCGDAEKDLKSMVAAKGMVEQKK